MTTAQAPHFRRFTDIENHTSAKTIQKLVELNEAEDLGPWVALEKVHGCNFSFVVFETDGLINVRVAKRSGLMLEGENLNKISTRKMLDRYRERAIEAYRIVQDRDDRSHKQIIIFGELFGGHYPHPEVPPIDNAHLAQKGVYYHNDNDFYAFDIHDGAGYLDYDVCMKIFQQCGFFFADPLHIAPLQEILTYPNTFASTIPQKCGHPPLECDNLAEGLVLKPLHEKRFANGRRVILKSKTEKFMEVAPPRSFRKNGVIVNDQPKFLGVDRVWDRLKCYVTENRLDNVRSHHDVGYLAPDSHTAHPVPGLKTQSSTTPRQWIGPLAKDALNEFLRDETEELIQIYEKLPKAQQKLVKNRLSVACQNLIAQSSLTYGQSQ